jgi:heme iron utilization protein
MAYWCRQKERLDKHQMNKIEAPFSPVSAARRVLRLAATGSLATLGKDGAPFASLVVVATTPDGEPILLLSKLAVHTQNLDRDSRVSLLLTSPDSETDDPLTGVRITILGEIASDSNPMLRRRFLARHEEAALYADFSDFDFYRLKVREAHLVAGFGRIVDLTASDFLTECSDCTGLIEAEAAAIAHMNQDHKDALVDYAKRLCQMPDGVWKATGCDPDGIDLRAGRLRTRLDFPEKICTAKDLREILVELAAQARSQDKKKPG